MQRLPVFKALKSALGLRIRSLGLMHSGQHKLIYLPIPKNANSYLKSIFLFNHPAARDYDPRTETALYYLRKKKHPVDVIVRRRATLAREDYTKIVAVRDPAKRLVSCFLDKLVKVRDNDDLIGKFCNDASRVLGTPVRKDEISFDVFSSFVFQVPDWRSDKHYRSQISLIRGIKFDHYFDVDAMPDLLEFLSGRGLSISLPSSRAPGIDKKTHYGGEPESGGKSAKLLTLGELETMSSFPPYGMFYDVEMLANFERRYSQDIDLYCSVKNISRSSYLKNLEGMVEGIA